jgi:hypothetical protein
MLRIPHTLSRQRVVVAFYPQGWLVNFEIEFHIGANSLILVNGVIHYLGTVAANVPVFHPPGDIYYIYGEPCWNDIDKGKLKDSEKTLSQCHFVHHKSHTG